MKMLLVIGVLGFVIASAILLLVVRGARRTRLNEEARRRWEKVSRLKAEADRSAEQAAYLEAERQRNIEEARLEAEQEAMRQAEEEARQKAEEARRAAETETLHSAEEESRREAEGKARLHAEQQASAAAELEARHRAEEEAGRRAEEARIAGEEEALRKAQEESRREQEANAEAEAQRRAEEEARRKTEEARISAEAESHRTAEEESRREAEVGPRHEEEAAASRGRRRARATQYRPSRPGPPPVRVSTDRTDARNGESVAIRNRAAEIELRLLFERGGTCKVALLPRRSEGLPEECTLSTSTGSIDVVALDDEWYQDVVPDELGALLQSGIVWTDEATGQEWSLSGREIFVLATGTTHRGFVSCPRMVLGREHAVLCTTSRLGAVEEVLREAGCGSWTQLGEEDGAPQDWVILSDVGKGRQVRGLVPRTPVPLEDAADILNALRPRPEIEIALEGGIPVGYSSWLAGYPPAIRVYGDPERNLKVLIDGQEAAASDEGFYTAPGWDEPRPHQVWCNNSSKTYSLIRPERSWKAWVAYSFPAPGGLGGGDRIAICGPLVRLFTDAETFAEEVHQREIIDVLPTNPVLLGAMPGQVFEAVPRHDVRGAQCIASPWFAPVWAFPAQPLLCDKRGTRILLVGELAQPCNAAAAAQPSKSSRALDRWCELILDAGRKGLAVDPPTPEAVELWHQYKRHARALWKRGR